MVCTELLAAFEQLARERGISAEVLFEAVEAALRLRKEFVIWHVN